MITDGGEDFDLFGDSKILQDEIAFAILNGLLIKTALKLKTQYFLADKIEKNRPCEQCENVRVALEKEGLDKALLRCYENTIKSLVDRELRICFTTINIYNSLL